MYAEAQADSAKLPSGCGFKFPKYPQDVRLVFIVHALLNVINLLLYFFVNWKVSMFVKSGTLLLLMMIGSTAVKADLVVDLKTAYGENSERSSEHGAKNLSMALKQSSYEIQQDTSKIEFRVDSPVGEVRVSFQDFKGRFALLDSGIDDSPAVVDISADSLDTDAGFIAMLLRSESFFDVENFPSMRFVGTSFEWFNKTHAVLKGDMTIQNVTLPVAFYVELVDVRTEDQYSQRITVKATTTIKRSRFGMYTLLPVVSDDVNLYLSIDALKQDVLVSMM